MIVGAGVRLDCPVERLDRGKGIRKGDRAGFTQPAYRGVRPLRLQSAQSDRPGRVDEQRATDPEETSQHPGYGRQKAKLSQWHIARQSSGIERRCQRQRHGIAASIGIVNDMGHCLTQEFPVARIHQGAAEPRVDLEYRDVTIAQEFVVHAAQARISEGRESRGMSDSILRDAEKGIVAPKTGMPNCVGRGPRQTCSSTA